MTCFPIPDQAVRSRNGRFSIEARSPDNGAIPYRTPEDAVSAAMLMRYHPGYFHARIIDHQSKAVVWEHWLDDLGIPPPLSLHVSDDGWVVLDALDHGLVAVSPVGTVTFRLGILPLGADPFCEGFDAMIFDRHVHETSIGIRWAYGSIAVFTCCAGRTFFVVVTGWGRRIILDLDGSRLSDTDEQDGLLAACIEAEQELVRSSLAQAAISLEDSDFLNRRSGANPVWGRWPNLEGIIGHCIRLGLTAALPDLQTMEPRTLHGGFTSCHALPDNMNVMRFFARPLITLAIRHLDAIPPGHACYSFFSRDESGYHLKPLPECIPDRDDRIRSVTRDQDADAILSHLGAPDFVRSFSEKGEHHYIWGEHWDYYHGTGADLFVLRMTWKAGTHGRVMQELSDRSLPTAEVYDRIHELMWF